MRNFNPVYVRFGSGADIARHQANVALPPKADIERRNGHVRFVPNADICGAANDARICRAYLIGPIDRVRQNVIPITS